MYCTACGNQMQDADLFCAHCGKSAQGPAEHSPPPPPPPKLSRDMAHKKIAGVCAGFARHFGWDVTLVRIFFLAAVFVHGVGLMGYIIAWICMPRDDIRPYPSTQTA